MSVASLFLFTAVYAAAVATPGPGVTAIVARGLARGLAGAPAFIAGFVAGDLVWFAFAVTGLSVIAKSFGTLFLFIKWAGVAYLVWLAWKLWTSSAEAAEIRRAEVAETPLRLFLAGLALTLGNPKVMIFFMAILPTIIDLQSVTLASGATLTLVIAVILTAVLSTYALLADRARKFVQTPRAVQLVNRICGTAIASAAAAIAAR